MENIQNINSSTGKTSLKNNVERISSQKQLKDKRFTLSSLKALVL